MNEKILKRLPEMIELISGYMDCQFIKLEYHTHWRIYFKFEGTFRDKAIRELKYKFEQWNLNSSNIGVGIHSNGTFHIAIDESNLMVKQNEK